MKIATWNVNSLKVRLSQVLDWLAVNQPDVLCLQETKLQDENFPIAEIAAAGYQTICTGQRTYNGVALLSKQAGAEIVAAIPGLDDPQKRVLSAIYDDVRIICIYVPNGQSVDSEKYQYKLKWLAALNGWLRDMLNKHRKLVVLGDFNIAPEERDVHDPALWEGQVLFSLPEREAFREILGLGLRDSFRLFDQPEKSYTWWDYRMMAFRRNRGLRIDHILVSHELAKICTACIIDKATRKLERPSDHAPVMMELRTGC
ncbi:MAG: exodeoxyribonuclease III [Nitrosospira sp.]|nr:exodeoxyribonuclease III [Nitrosospira sp.]MDN5882782.1 exodeoxyribonuclease III [Nitrosospira sp.]MDN5934979.1 exodeoxyribonuclease III [Nitrosospira sp.]